MEQASADQDGTNGLRRSTRTRNKSTLQNACGTGDIHTSLSTSTKKKKSKIKKPPSASTIRKNYSKMLRKEINRLRKIRERSLETPEQRKARQEQQRLYKINKRQNETPSQRKKRLERDRLRKKLTRNGNILPQPAKLMHQMLISEDGDLPATPQLKIIENIEKQRLNSIPKSKQPKCMRKIQNKIKQCESVHQNILNTEENILDITIKEEPDLLYHQQDEKITIEVPQMYHDAKEMPEYFTKNEIEVKYSPQSNYAHSERLTQTIPDNGLFHIPKELVKNEHSTSHVHVPEEHANMEHGGMLECARSDAVSVLKGYYNTIIAAY